MRIHLYWVIFHSLFCKVMASTDYKISTVCITVHSILWKLNCMQIDNITSWKYFTPWFVALLPDSQAMIIRVVRIWSKCQGTFIPRKRLQKEVVSAAACVLLYWALSICTGLARLIRNVFTCLRDRVDSD